MEKFAQASHTVCKLTKESICLFYVWRPFYLLSVWYYFTEGYYRCLDYQFFLMYHESQTHQNVTDFTFWYNFKLNFFQTKPRRHWVALKIGKCVIKMYFICTLKCLDLFPAKIWILTCIKLQNQWLVLQTCDGRKWWL